MLFFKVPKYEVTFPFEANIKGGLVFNSLNHRRLLKRGIDDKGNGIQYKIIISTPLESSCVFMLNVTQTLWQRIFK